ncbi:hypothetical protein [Accumulibacter sp.]
MIIKGLVNPGGPARRVKARQGQAREHSGQRVGKTLGSLQALL